MDEVNIYIHDTHIKAQMFNGKSQDFMDFYQPTQ